MKIKNKRVIVLFLAILLLNIILVYADELGCCINPGAGLLTCSTERLAFRDIECCPTPESSFPAYYKPQNPNGPANANECIANFFFIGQGCSSVQNCTTLGCCCSESGATVKSEAQCAGTGIVFHKGQTDCTQVCAVAVTQCNDNLDNDNNGCKDFSGGDTGCASPADNVESGGSCIQQSVGCSNPSLVPQLSNFEITPVKGQKRFLLKWQDECRQNTVSYDILRCEGDGCTNFALIAVTNTNSFEDASEELTFDKTYTFQIKAKYSIQTATPTIEKTANLGNAECFQKSTTDIFCLNNAAFFCDAFNKLTAQGTVCPSTQFCTSDGSTAVCVSKINCNYPAANPFGLYYTLDGCEANRYCFYDRSYSTVDSCFSCDVSMSCYDYKSESACTRDNCKIKNCKWKNSAEQIGVGTCVSTSQYNCQWCDKKGTSALENSRSFNEVFDLCTQEKSDSLSEGDFKCYYSNNTKKSRSCNEIVCTDYSTNECSSVQIRHDQNNKLTNPSNDKCSIKVCQNINSLCVKNADGDNIVDCSSAACEKDFFAPNTTIIVTGQNLLIQIYDKTGTNTSEVLKTSPDYKTFLCVETCGAEGHPYSISTASRTIIISNLNAYDGSNGSKLLTFNEGTNAIRYYSQDPSKNIGEVKKIFISAFSNSAAPIVLSLSVSDGSKVLDKYYTSNQMPTINIQFVEPAIVTFAKLVSKDETKTVNLQGNTPLSTTVSLSVVETLSNGEYTFGLYAKNEKNILMTTPFTSTILIDNKVPTLNITPSNNSIVNDTSNVLIRLIFDEVVNLDTVRINSQNVTASFSTTNNSEFTSTLSLSDGNKKLEVTARDFAKNLINISAFSFIVDAAPTAINLTVPKFGTASDYTFNITVETDNIAECRYSLDSNFGFESMIRFTMTDSAQHMIRDFNRIPNGDTNIHKLYVICKAQRGQTLKPFDINVDTTQPQLKNLSTFPNPIADIPPVTTLTAELDEEVICKFSSNSNAFDSMEGKFEGFDDNNFRTINRQSITVQGQGSFLYFAACKNKAGLVSATKDVSIRADSSFPIKLISHTPILFNSTNVTLLIETNKKAVCTYSNSPTIQGTQFGQPDYIHRKELTLGTGKYTFYTECKDALGNSDKYILNFTVDTTAPVMLFVNDTSTLTLFPEKTCNTDRLRIKWLGEDLESGVKNYNYTIFKKPSTQIIDWRESVWYSQPNEEWTWIESLNLEDNVPYFFKVKARNYVNLESLTKDSDGITVNTTLCMAGPSCGDGRVDSGELCDPNGVTPVFGFINKCTQFSNFIGGNLGCTYSTSSTPCTLDTTNCIIQQYCGDGKIDPGEHCETKGSNAFGIANSCDDLGFASGTLSCAGNCFLDTSRCTPKQKCNNGLIDPGEECDGINLGPLNGQCTQYSPLFTGGTLRCSSNCKLDVSGCAGAQGNCGNGIINIGEKCDGTTFGIISSCQSYSNFSSGGTLRCTSTSCELDTSVCIPKAPCGNGLIDTGEECDGGNLGILSSSCNQYTSYFRSGTLSCDSNCKLNTFSCEAAPLCSNGLIDIGEECDGSNFGSLRGTCINYSNSFIGGNLGCTSSCRINTSSCAQSKICNNGVIDLDIGEQCESTNFGVFSGSCGNYSKSLYIGGNLVCNNCYIDTTGCQLIPPAPKCQDGAVNQINESCDKQDLKGETCETLGYSSGALGCTGDCKYNKSSCIIPPPPKTYCGDGRVQQPNDKGFNEQCDLPELGGKTCATFSDAYSSGLLNCFGDCTFDYGKCIPKDIPKCQNGVVDRLEEECDKQDLKGNSCKSFGFDSGTLKCTNDCKFDKSECSNPGPKTCGDGIVQKPNSGNINEQCDKTDLDGKNCASFDAYTGVGLKCKDDCTFDYSSCTLKIPAPTCGDGIVSSGEQCDKTSLDGKTCQSLGYASGTLSCNVTSCLFNTSLCTPPPPCGNGRLDSGELCDDKGPIYGSIKNCTSFTNFIGGNLGCNNCQLDKTNCVQQPYCGDKAIQKGEHCDDGILGSANNCQTLGFASGSLSCASNCFLDTSKCVPKQKCSNGLIDAGEECDGINLGPLNGQCTQYSSLFTGGTLRCSSNCKLDVSGCAGAQPSNSRCGDVIIDPTRGEKCDGTLFGIISSCESFGNFSSGTLRCTSTSCELDTSNCTAKALCGNSLIDVGEECDGSNLGILTTSCNSYSSFFSSGNLRCGNDCKLDTFDCQESPKCGNSFLDSGETCDSTNFGNITDTRCSNYSSSFISGTLSCRDCKINTRDCKSNTTTPTITCRDRGDCKLNEPCTDSSDCESRFCSNINNRCSLPTCNDGIQNQGESSTDCGEVCIKCQNGKTCNKNNDCQSNFCSSGLCKEVDTCLDGKLTSGEADVDCGKACPTKCSNGRNCVSNDDCGSSQCISSICKSCESGDSNCDGIADTQEAAVSRDSDGDGMPDEWEIQHGLNPNDPSDATEDTDNDGLTNFQEFDVQRVRGKSTDPNKEDTDDDTFADKEEIDKNTNPVDSADFPKSNKGKTILLILGALVLISGFGYLAYTAVTRKREEKFEMPRQREAQEPRAVQPQFRRFPLRAREEEIRMRASIKEREEQKEKERQRLFEAFGKEEKEKPKEEVKETKAEKPKSKEAKPEKEEVVGGKYVRQTKKAPKKKQTSEEIFAKLKEIAKEGKQKNKERRHLRSK